MSTADDLAAPPKSCERERRGAGLSYGQRGTCPWSQDNSSSCQSLIQESSCCFLLFIWEAICTVSLKIRSRRQRQGLAKVLTNGLDSRWVCTALCSDKWLLCFPRMSGLPKHSRQPLFSFALLLPQQRAELGRLQSLHCQLQSSPAFYQAVSLPTQGRKLLCSGSGGWRSL